ncbi:MAG: VanW family protein [Myxococcales bacterium]|nr:VanW family protein [Myxococcales bacterium]
MVRRSADRRRGSIYLGLAAGLFVTSGALMGGYMLSEQPPKSPAAPAATTEAGADHAALAQAVEATLGGSVKLTAVGRERTIAWRELGVSVDPGELGYAARKAADGDAVPTLQAAGALPIRLDRAVAMKALAGLKAQVDRAPTDAFLDLEARTINDDAPGFAIDVYASLDRIEAAARSGAATVELVGVPVPAAVTRATLGIDDISHVLGTFKTTFPVGDKDRNFNLKLAASKLNGYVLQPGVEFSFNGVVGDRTEKEGYKIAHVITAGEMVDGLAGGTCQISTTLFGASFFAGIEIVKTTNHSRPSTYVTMGLDATVVYPTTDLIMKNPYDFPVVIHYRVARGESVVEILGKERPWDQIAFERRVIETTPFSTEERLDEALPEGFETPDQSGFDGYKLVRYRKYYKGGREVKQDKWTLTYKPVTEYLRKGTNPDPTLPVPKVKPPHTPKAPGDGTGRVVQ